MDKGTFDALSNIAARQRGYFSAAQAGQLGISADQLTRLLKAGHISRSRRSVYQAAGTPASRWSQVLIAALAAGPGAVISHASAAAVHRFEYGQRGPVELTMLAGTYSRAPGTVVHRSIYLQPEDIVVRSGAKVTSPERTVMDIASRIGPRLTAMLIDEGLVARRWTVTSLHASLARSAPNLAGTRCLGRILAERSELPMAESMLEGRVFTALAPLAPFATHFVTEALGSVYVLDVAWPAQHVAAEVIGRSHRVASRGAFDRERHKINALAATGWKVAHLVSTMSDREMVCAVRQMMAQAS